MTDTTLKGLYSYFQSMIELISLMCLNRNYKGINNLLPDDGDQNNADGKICYSLDFAIDCFLDPKISSRMRSNLAKMIITLHMDKDPLE